MLKDFVAFQMAKELYQRCKPLRMSLQMKDQLLRASSSVALNLAESNGMRSDKERQRYFTLALGSLRECEAILELDGVKDDRIEELARRLGVMLFKLCKLGRSSKALD